MTTDFEQACLGIGIVGEMRFAGGAVGQIDDEHAAGHALAVLGQGRPADDDLLDMGLGIIDMGGAIGQTDVQAIGLVGAVDEEQHEASPCWRGWAGGQARRGGPPGKPNSPRKGRASSPWMVSSMLLP